MRVENRSAFPDCKKGESAALLFFVLQVSVLCIDGGVFAVLNDLVRSDMG